MSKIAFINGPGNGGAENVTFRYASILRRAGENCCALILQSPGDQQGISPDVPEGMDVEIQESRTRYYIFRLNSFLARVKPDIVFCSMPDRSIMLLLLKRMHIYHGKIIIRDCNMPSRHRRIIRILSRLLYRSADAVIAQTDEMKQEMKLIYKLRDEAITVIHNPLNSERLQKMMEKGPIKMDHNYKNYISVGRLSSQKNQILLLDAFAELLKTQPKSRLYIVGGENEKEYAKQVYDTATTLGINNSVFFEGFRTNPIQYLMAADVYVLSSDYEGMPNSMLEAMYIGIPVAATKCIPFISHVIHDGQNGYTSNCGDISGLAEAMFRAGNVSKSDSTHYYNDSNHSICRLFEEL